MKFKPLLGSDLSGHIGGIVASHNTYGPYFRQRVRPVNAKTTAQRAQRSAVAKASQQWRGLDPSVHSAWNAAHVVKTSRKGDKVTLTGQAAWMFVNTIRARAGLYPINAPPTSPNVPILSAPSMTFTAADAVDMDVQLAEPWNASDGWLVVSGSLSCSPGIAYRPADRAIAIILGPKISTPIAVPLPFAVPIGGKLRVTLHSGIPDGRQSPYVDAQEVNLIYDPAPPAILHCLEVTLVGTKKYLWRFDGPITVAPGSEPNLIIDSDTSAVVVQAGTDSLLATYTTSAGTHKVWSIPAQPSTISEPIAFPEAGVTD